MNSFQSFVNYIFKITETYELDESCKDVALLKLGSIARHLLRAFQHLGTSGEDYTKNALSEIENKFLPQLNSNLAKLAQCKQLVRQEIVERWEDSVRKSYLEYEKLYQKDLTLYPITSRLALNLETKIIADSFTFKDFGLIEDISNRKKLQFSFDFKVAIQRNKGKEEEEVVEGKIK